MTNKFAPGPRGGPYAEADDANMQIEQVGQEFFLDRWAGGGWKNIAVFRTHEDALHVRTCIAKSLKERDTK